jgi:hypothetical protein
MRQERAAWRGRMGTVQMLLDNAVTSTVTSTFVLEGNGRVEEYVGGYEDWLRQRTAALGQRSQRLCARLRRWRHREKRSRSRSGRRQSA